MLDSNYIVGLTDGEGSFGVAVSYSKTNVGFTILPRFRILMHEKEISLLKQVKYFFGFGEITGRDQGNLRKKGVRASDVVVYEVSSLAGCNRIRDFFNKNQLQSSKKKDFELWSECIRRMLSGSHIKSSGFLEIMKIRDQMNLTGKRRAVGRSKYRDYEWFKQEILGKTQQLV